MNFAGAADGVNAARGSGGTVARVGAAHTGDLRPTRSRALWLPMIDGTWLPLSAELSGQPLPMPATRLTVAGQSYVVQAQETRDEGVLRIDTTAAPATIDIVGVNGPNAGRTIPAIFRVADDVLEMCYDVGGGDRPDGFATAPGEYRLLVRYRRA